MPVILGAFLGPGNSPWVTNYESGWWYTRYDYRMVGPFDDQGSAEQAWEEYANGPR